MDNQQELDKNMTTNSKHIPWLYDLEVEDISWVVTSSFMIFTMQTGFGMLEAGCVSVKNEVNIMMKNVVDIVLGGFTYWVFGYSFSFGSDETGNAFISFGDFLLDPSSDEPLKGAISAAFLFQMSFATTSTTIVSGAMAERCNFKAYCLFSFLNTIVYCIPAGWVWGERGFLKTMGVVDIAGSGPVHLVGGFSALASAMMLGPRFGRYDNGIGPLPMGSPVNAVMGLFVLWWGWLAFNSGSTYGLTGEKYQYAAKAAVMTVMASFGGGCTCILYSLIKQKGKTNPLHIINGILGSLVSITAGCFLYQCWESLLVGAVGSLLVCTAMPLLDKVGIDDPVGATAVHGIGGIWGVLAVGLFARNPYPLNTTNGRSGLFKNGDWYLLKVQFFAVICLSFWSFSSSILLLWLVNLIVKIRMEVEGEILGADLIEHGIEHYQVEAIRTPSTILGSFVSPKNPKPRPTQLEKKTKHNNISFIELLYIKCKKYKTKHISLTNKNKYGNDKLTNKFFANRVGAKNAGNLKKKVSIRNNPPAFVWLD